MDDKWLDSETQIMSRDIKGRKRASRQKLVVNGFRMKALLLFCLFFAVFYFCPLSAANANSDGMSWRCQKCERYIWAAKPNMWGDWICPKCGSKK